LFKTADERLACRILKAERADSESLVSIFVSVRRIKITEYLANLALIAVQTTKFSTYCAKQRAAWELRAVNMRL
jgi:hypothetical protein